MEVSNADVESILEDVEFQEDTYSGGTCFLYSSKIREGVDVAGVCEVLATSAIFSFALDSHGRIYFKENGRLKSQLLNIEITVAELGMTVSGHNDFMSANPGITNAYALSRSIDLFLSDKKLFNSAFGFPAESARIFMRPIAIRAEGDESHELFVPYIKIYAGGIISISLVPVLGFENMTVREVIDNQVNKSRRNINSVLCERELYLASTECQISKIPFRERVTQRKAYEITINAALGAPEKLEFSDESLTFFELVSVNQLTLTDIARNLLSVVGRAITLGSVRTRISWFGSQRRGYATGEFWYGKPIIYIKSHTGQKESSTENWAAHKHLVDSVMTRTHQTDSVRHVNLALSDMRNFDDFNNFYHEAVSLMLSSTQVESFIEQNDSYTFNNLTSDIQVLNEVSHFIRVYYSYASLDLDKCKTAIDVARLELKIMNFEESLISAYKYGEVAKYLDEVKRGDLLTTVCKLLNKKIEIVRKALELDEKISSESATRRITIIFGIIASATLSPELMQPLVKLFGITYGDPIDKLIGISASVVGVITLLAVTHYFFRSIGWMLRMIRR